MTNASRLLCLCVALLVIGGAAFSCPVCFGEKESPMAAGMNTAVLFMLGVTGSVFSLIGLFFVLIWRRYRQRQLSDQTFVNERGVLQSKNEKGVMEWNNF